MNQTISGLVTIATAIIGVAILAVLVSRQAQTPEVIKAASGGFSEALRAAVSPLSGGGYASTFGYQPPF